MSPGCLVPGLPRATVCQASLPCAENNVKRNPNLDQHARPLLRALPAKRLGTAAVEFAMVVPLIALLTLGMFELGRAMIVKNILSDAARKGCRTGIRSGGNSATISNDVNSILSDNNIDPKQC